MNLLVDIGNSHIKFAPFDRQFTNVTTVIYDKKMLRDSLLANEMASLPVPDSVVCINVAGKMIENQFVEQCCELWGKTPEFIHVCQYVSGVTNGYKNIDELGVDRWMAMIGAWNSIRGNVMVVDIGSAMTIDLVNGDGQHLGGYIVPGDYLMAKSLLYGTGIKLTPGGNRLSLQPGKTTEECIANGTARLLTSMIMDIYHSLNEGQQDIIQCVITGGGAINIIEQLSIPVVHQPMLVFDGMRIVKGYT